LAQQRWSGTAEKRHKERPSPRGRKGNEETLLRKKRNTKSILTHLISDMGGGAEKENKASRSAGRTLTEKGKDLVLQKGCPLGKGGGGAKFVEISRTVKGEHSKSTFIGQD